MCFRGSTGIFLLSTLLAIAGCGDEKSSTPTGPSDGEDQLVLTLENLGDPSPYHFALWAQEGTGTTLVLRFAVDDGAPVTLGGEPIPSFDQSAGLGSADRLLVTVETDTTGTAPSARALLAGTVTGDGATLTTGDAAALGVDLSGATGSFLFDTPTTADPTDCGRGLWWTDGEGAAGLGLPVLPAGWVYQGWVTRRDSGAVYSTGRFANPGVADSDGAGATAGGGSGYPFPGQDFVVAAGNVPVLQVDDGAFGSFVTIEPDPDASADPFFFRLLDRAAGSGNFYLHQTNLLAMPTGAYYEIWAGFPDTLVSVGTFVIRNRKIVDPVTLADIKAFPIGCNLLNASEILVSVELDSDPDPGPSGSFLLAGTIEEDSVTLLMSHASALGFDPSSISGAFTLDTPSDTITSNYDHGIWFYQIAGGATTSTLTLPDAPSGWHYQTWLYRTSGSVLDTLSMGTFTSPNGYDSDGAGPYADTTAVPPAFPGQDYLRTDSRELDNGGHATMISVEPDDDPQPSRPFLVLLQDSDIDGPPPGQTESLSNLSALLPTGSAGFQTSNLLEMDSAGGALPSIRLRFGRK